MGYTEELLATNEKIVYRTKQHWMAPIFGTVSGVIILIVGIALFGFGFVGEMVAQQREEIRELVRRRPPEDERL